MKRIGFLSLILCVSFVGVAGAQQSTTSPLAPSIKALGTYPGGTWFTTESINDHGWVVGLGDVPPDGFTHPLAVRMFGRHAGEWIDLGALGGVQPKGFEYESLTQISNTGLVASHSIAPDGQMHGVAWTKETGMIDLGTLADTGHNSSSALGTNKSGSLIVGWSGIDGAALAPVVWTPDGEPGVPANVWNIHKLPIMDELQYCQAWWVNDYPQISGVCGDHLGTVTGVVWNLGADGWQLKKLPPDPAYPSSNAYGINNKGEIVGVALSAGFGTWLPRLWKPLNTDRTEYSQPIELALPQAGFKGCESVGINDHGDIVGDCWNNGKDLPVRWIAEDPAFSELIEFPGSWGYSWGVNNDGIAAVTYGGGRSCQGKNYISCGGATEFPER